MNIILVLSKEFIHVKVYICERWEGVCSFFTFLTDQNADFHEDPDWQAHHPEVEPDDIIQNVKAKT